MLRGKLLRSEILSWIFVWWQQLGNSFLCGHSLFVIRRNCRASSSNVHWYKSICSFAETGDVRQMAGDVRFETGNVRLETWDRRRETGHMRQDKCERRRGTGGEGQEAWDKRRGKEAWNRRRETGHVWKKTWDRRRGTDDRRQETWYKRQEKRQELRNLLIIRIFFL